MGGEGEEWCEGMMRAARMSDTTEVENESDQSNTKKRKILSFVFIFVFILHLHFLFSFCFAFASSFEIFVFISDLSFLFLSNGRMRRRPESTKKMSGSFRPKDLQRQRPHHPLHWRRTQINYFARTDLSHIRTDLSHLRTDVFTIYLPSPSLPPSLSLSQ